MNSKPRKPGDCILNKNTSYTGNTGKVGNTYDAQCYLHLSW